MDEGKRLLTEMAESVGIQSWRLRRLAERGLIPEPGRLGPFRTFDVADTETIREAAIKAGYLKADRQAVAAR